MRQFIIVLITAGLAFWLSAGTPALASGLAQEYVTTSPLVVDGVLYVASFTSPNYRGHLRAIDVFDTIATTLWDAAEKVPFAGADAGQPESIRRDNATRSLYTNVSNSLLPLAASSAPALQEVLDVDSLAEAEFLLHTVRGRRHGSASRPAGDSEDPQRLWSFSRSSPLMIERSLVDPGAASRDRVLYLGADDGLLHAFFVSGVNPGSESYLVDDPEGGIELWGYLPGSFLSHLKKQPFSEPGEALAIRLDGSPLAREVFVDLDGDGLRRWHTLLVATGTILKQQRSCVFVLDVTDPYRPALLWEALLPGEGVGRTRGVTLGACLDSAATCLYLSADFSSSGRSGLHVLAATLTEGRLLWQFSAPYEARGPVSSATPAVPVLADLDGDATEDVLLLGDLVGRLWALELATGEARGGGPVFTAPGGVAEPIGAEVAVAKKLVVFGTGGVAEADDHAQYALYAVEILPEGARLRWSYPLQPGEKVWQAPRLDRFGNLLMATSRDFRSLADVGAQPTSGRVVALNHEGEEMAGRDTDAATLGRVVTAPGLALSVDLTGEVTQYGTPSRLSGPLGNLGTVRLFSWRQR